MAKISLRSYGKEIESLIDRGQYDQALAHCRHILRYYPKHIDTYRLMAKAYLEATRYGDASDVFQRVLSSIPDDFVSHLGMSIIREDEGNLDAAIWHMERAFEIQPANVAIQSELRRLYGRRDGIEPPRVRLTRGALARMYYKGELYQQAISELRAALTADGARTDLQVILAQTYLRAGMRVEAAETSSAILKKLPYCLEANRILSEIMVGTDRAQDAAIYRQRAIAMNPYLGQVSPKAPTPDQVPDGAVLVEKLDLRLETGSAAPAQPQWAASLGVDIDAAAKKKEEVPEWLVDLQGVTQPTGKEIEEEAVETTKVSPFVMSALEEDPELLATLDQGEQTIKEPTEDLLPDWMKEAGWSPTNESSKEAEMGFSFGEDITSEGEGLARAEIPDWLKAIAPKEAFEHPQEPDEVDPRLLAALDSAAAPWLEETPPDAGDTVASWLDEKDKAKAPFVAPEPTDETGIPAWLAGGAALAAGLAAAGAEKEEEKPIQEQAPEAVPAEQVPDWLSAETATEAGAPAAMEMEEPTVPEEALEGEPEAVPPAEIPDWLRALGPATEEPATTGESELPEWLAATAAVSQINQEANASEEAPEEAAPEWLSALEPEEPSTQEPITSEEEASAYAWLEELTAQQVPVDATFPEASEETGEGTGWEPPDEEGISPLEAAGISAVALGATVLSESDSEEETAEEEPTSIETFEAEEWIPESFEMEDSTGVTAIAPDIFEPTAAAELAPEEVLPEWLRQANPEDEKAPEETVPAEDSNLPDWLRKMQAESEPSGDEGLWSYPTSEREATEDLSWLSEVTEQPEIVEDWLRIQASLGESEEPAETVPFAEKFAEPEIGEEEPAWLTEDFSEEKAPQREEEGLPAWMAGLAAGAAAGAILGKEGEQETSTTPEENPAPEEPTAEEAYESPEGALPEEIFEETIGEPAQPEIHEEPGAPAAVIMAAGAVEAARQVEESPAEETAPAEEVSQEEETVIEETQPVSEILAEEEAQGTAQPALSDEDAAFAWLESLAVKQGATEALMFTDEERQEEPPEWVKQAAEAEEPISEVAAEPAFPTPEEHKAEEPSGADETAETPSLPEWLLAAAAAGAITSAIPSKEKDQDVLEDTQPTKAIAQVEETKAEVTQETEIQAAAAPATEESEIDSAYAWLEGLAVKQGAEEALLLTPEERQEEPPDWVKSEMEAAVEAATEPVQIQPEEPEGKVEAEEEAFAESPAEEIASEEMGMTGEKVAESDRPGLAGAVLLGAAAEAAREEEEIPLEESPRPAEEVTAVEGTTQAGEGAEEGEVPELPDWLADLEEGTLPEADQKWTPEQAALTQPLQNFDENVTIETTEAEIPAEETTKLEAQRLDINQASLVELERLPGVGFVRAQALIEYRKANGSFESMIELENVEGFDPDLVDVLRDYATILSVSQATQPAARGEAGGSISDARQAISNGNVDEAIEIYQALMFEPELLPEVVKDLNDALYRYPVDVSIWMTLGDAEMRSGQTQEALDAYTKAEELLR